MSNEIKRATGLLVIEVNNSNPNGDPDRESDPRQRPNGLGEISPVSFKRKLRDLVEDTAEGSVFQSLCKDEKLKLSMENYRILESRGRDRPLITREMTTHEGQTGNNQEFDQSSFLKSTFVQKYWDARLFGNTFLEGDLHKGYIKTGVAQFVMGVSIAPIQIVRHTNTNKSGVEEGKNAGMAPLAYRVVEHGVYIMPFYINPSSASKSGCTSKDIDLLKALIPYAYDHTRSAIRPDVRIRHAWYMEHKNSLGSCADYKLIEALTPTRIGSDLLKSSDSWQDYEDKTCLPDDLLNKLDSCVDLMEGL